MKVIKDLNGPSVLEELHKTEEELHRDEKRVKIAFVLGMLFLLVLISGASYFIIQSIAASKSTQTIIKEIPVSVSITPTTVDSSTLTTTTPAPIFTAKTTDTVKDHYINIGYGTNQSTDWADVFGAVITADLAQYENIKEEAFEAFINVPSANGTVSVRLYNVTDKHPVWNSEVTREANATTYHFISPLIVYDSGPKLYQVQMKTQFNVVANLSSSRVHVVTK